jgi:MFS family permease
MNQPSVAETPTSDRFWLRQLDPIERSTLVGCFAGYSLDGMDFMVYSFVLPTLIGLWHIGKGPAGLLGTSALILSSVGGWLAGLAADRFGRVRVLQFTIVWFAAFTFLSGFAQNFWQLLALRGLQGLGMGGEWAVGSVLIGETIRAKFRGRAVGTVQSGWAIGWAFSAILYAICFKFLSSDVAWRAMFWIGLAPAGLAIFVRRHVKESPVFAKNKAASRVSTNGSFLRIFSPSIRRVTCLASLSAVGAQGGYYAINTWLPLYLNGRGLSVTHTASYLIVVIAGSFAGYLVSAHLADRIGRRATLILFPFGAVVAVLLYTVLPISDLATLLLGFPLGFFTSGTFSPMGAFFTELFPTAMRGSGQGFSYNFGRGAGSLFPAAVGYLSLSLQLGRAIAVCSATAYALMVVAVIMLPETRGVDLDGLDAGVAS